MRTFGYWHRGVNLFGSKGININLNVKFIYEALKKKLKRKLYINSGRCFVRFEQIQ